MFLCCVVYQLAVSVLSIALTLDLTIVVAKSKGILAHLRLIVLILVFVGCPFKAVIICYEYLRQIDAIEARVFRQYRLSFHHSLNDILYINNSNILIAH